ncbi:MAG TPA: RNA methyltransferase [Anaerolineales bacterium]|nr:RNA methyltransferase [Anaerolineales bacterium]HRQ91659.1 RNA methyltransferase [Anaerolineales bacterium]
MDAITSRSNPKVKLARSLHERKARQQSGQYIIEGVFHIGAALDAGAAVALVLHCPSLLRGEFAQTLPGRLQQAGVEVLEVSADVMASLSEKDNPQGIIAVAQQHTTPLAVLSPQAEAVFLAAVAPQDPGNLGTLLRTLDAVGGNGLLLLEGGTDPWHPQAVRAGMGAHFSIPIMQASFADFATWAAAQGVSVYGSSAKATLDYRKVAYKPPCALLLGSEREGLSPEQLAACQQVVSLPMRGRVTSLNLSVAAGIWLYQVLG